MQFWWGFFNIPDFTEAFRTVVELWHSHANTLVQLLQQDATQSLHLLKIRESDRNLPGTFHSQYTDETLGFSRKRLLTQDVVYVKILHLCTHAILISFSEHKLPH